MWGTWEKLDMDKEGLEDISYMKLSKIIKINKKNERWFLLSLCELNIAARKGSEI